MKTRVLIIIGICLVVISTIVLGAIMMSDNAQQREQEWSQSSIAIDARGNCGEKYLAVGNNECVLNPQFIESNIVIIYDVVENGGTRMSVAPHVMVINMTGKDTVKFENDGANTVNIFVSDGKTANPLFDLSKRISSFDNVKPSSQRTLHVNDTGYYQFLVQNSREGEMGEIIALSGDTNSLPVEIRAKMAQSIVSGDFNKREIGLISVGSGGAEPGITIGIHEKFQDKPDAERFYYEKYKKMIPFDVPIGIEFTEPIMLQTG